MAAAAHVHPQVGPVKLGRPRPSPHAPRMRAARFLAHMDLPKAPDTLACSPLAQDCMDRMLLNDKISDCTIVTTMKCSAQVLGSAGTKVIYSNAQALDLYKGACGYDGTPATDNGGDEDQVIDYVTLHGIEKGLHKWAGKLSVDGSDPEQVRQVVCLTRNLFYGVELAQAWTQAPNRSVLTRAGGPVPDLGHAIPGGGRNGFYTPQGAVWTMWGGIEVLVPWDVLAEYTAPGNGGEIHTMVSHDMIAKGLDNPAQAAAWAKIASAFAALGGTLTA